MPERIAGIDAVIREAAAGIEDRQAPAQMALAPDLAPPPARPLGGRPPARRNRRTEEFAQWLAARGALPGDRLAELVRGGWQALQRDLNCSPLDAYDRWLKAVEALMPYAHPRLASLELKGDALGQAGGLAALHLLAVRAASEASGGGFGGLGPEPLPGSPREIEADAWVSEHVPAHGPASGAGGEGSTDAG